MPNTKLGNTRSEKNKSSNRKADIQAQVVLLEIKK